MEALEMNLTLGHLTRSTDVLVDGDQEPQNVYVVCTVRRSYGDAKVQLPNRASSKSGYASVGSCNLVVRIIRYP